VEIVNVNTFVYIVYVHSYVYVGKVRVEIVSGGGSNYGNFV